MTTHEGEILNDRSRHILTREGFQSGKYFRKCQNMWQLFNPHWTHFFRVDGKNECDNAALAAIHFRSGTSTFFVSDPGKELGMGGGVNSSSLTTSRYPSMIELKVGNGASNQEYLS
ncbi:hypothetical protein TNCV_3004531 [Trichonephila clavipes]|nr:hypothetical protein TNCV_3004531 [Trichonephila clavipes]